MEKRKLNYKNISIFGVVIVLMVVLLPLCITKVDNGRVGVIYSMNGGVRDEVLTQGWHFKLPTQKVSEYDITAQQLYLSQDAREGSQEDESLNLTTDSGTVNADFEMSYYFDPDSVVGVYKKYGGMTGETIVNSVIRGRIRSLVNEVTADYSAIEIYSDKRAEVNAAITEKLATELKEEGIVVTNASLSEVRIDEKTKQLLEDRNRITQQTENERLNQQLIEEQRKTELAEAQKDAEVKKAQAQADADAARIRAEGEAEANRRLAQSITPELIDYKEAEARMEHGWIEVITDSAIVDTSNESE